ncbi:MAG: hypothetical protein ABFE08_16395 [Armatimonadia bacterium]
MPNEHATGTRRLRGEAVIACALASAFLLLSTARTQAQQADVSSLWVNDNKGDDNATGDRAHPLKSISVALSKLSEPLLHGVTIHWAGGTILSSGGRWMLPDRLQLMLRMLPSAGVRIVGEPNEAGALPVLAFRGDPLVDVVEGNWWLENLQIGNGNYACGLRATGPGVVRLSNVTFRIYTNSGCAIQARRGGLVELSGAIKINEHLHDQAPPDSFASIVAEYSGIVRYVDSDHSSLDMGNGQLSTSYYGVIELGAKDVRVTSWGGQSNCVAINDSGRIDFHGSTIRLCARLKGNTPVGLEDDGHVLGEGAHLIIEGDNNNAIVLQKNSAFGCTTVELRGPIRTAVSAMSGSTFHGGFLGDIGSVDVDTGACVAIGEVQGRITGQVTAIRGGTVVLPGGKVIFGQGGL